jgi:GT2 family glycosyltransferase
MSAEAAVAIDVVVVAFGADETLATAVRRALEIPHVGSLTVVDHRGDAEAALGPDVEVVVDRSNPGFGAGQNRGASRGSSPFILMVNPDAVVDAEAVGAGAAVLATMPGAAALQGVVMSDAGEVERSQGVQLRPLHLWGRALGLRRLLRLRGVASLASRVVPGLRDHVTRVPDGIVEVENLAATVLLVRREAFERIGGFDERYFLYGEDLDLCTRLRRDGWTLLATDAVWARHTGGASSATWFDREVVWWEGTMQFATQWWSVPQRLVAAGAAVIRATGLSFMRPRSAATVWRRVVARHLLR